jgi:hypothetical protein
VESALTVRAARRAADDAMALLDRHAAEIERRADERLGDVLAMLDRRLASIEQRADARLAGAVLATERQVSGAIERADVRLAETLVEVRALREEAQAAVAEARGLIADVRRTHATAAARLDYWTDCDQNGLCWQGAATDTMLAIRRAALSVDRAMPQIVASAEASAQGVKATAQASAQTAENLARITQPGPRWLRYLGLGLGVAAPAAQTALPFVLRRAELR